MKIDVSIAKEIVTQLSETIGQHINIMNTDGIIIASSDSSRIGQLHEGALKLITEDLPLLTVEDDIQYAGAKSGVNLPILFENELVGTIGITGPVSEVLKYGQIIRRMTEILLLDNRIKEQIVIEQKARDRFFDEWILGRMEEKDEKEFYRIAETLNINVSTPKRIAVLSASFSEKVTDQVHTEVSRYIRQLLKKNLAGNAFRTVTRMICIVEEEKAQLLVPTIQMAAQVLKEKYGCLLHIGIANIPATLHLYDNYERASDALEIALKRNVLFVEYDELDFDFIIRNIPQETRLRFLSRLFGKWDDSAEKDLQFAHIYLEENGSLSAIAERLYLHKNTVKYRISKLTERTGVDIRTCNGAYIFTLAKRLWDQKY